MILKLGVFLVAVGIVKAVIALAIKWKDREGEQRNE